MSTPKFILTADDYGPIEFINKGIIHHVGEGHINSVQVISNFNQTLLNKRMDMLWKAVPQGKTVDIGLHLTLASGLPLIKKSEGMNTPDIWGKFVSLQTYRAKNGRDVSNFVFSKYKDFYLEYELLSQEPRTRIEQTIIQEFKAQKSQLETALAVSAQQNSGKPNALKFTCVSNHFDFFTLSDKFFTLYRDVAGPNLAIRSPRRIPLKKSTGYVTALASFGVGTIKQRTTARKNIRLFDEYKYCKTATIKSTGYIDVDLYAGLGGLSTIPAIATFHNRYKRLEKMITRSKGNEVWEHYPSDNKIVEIVFHLGATSNPHPIFSRKDEQGYVGINYKYFDNRLIESRVLTDICKKADFKTGVLNNLTSWENCPSLTFTAD